MLIIYGKNQSLPLFFRIFGVNVTGNLFQHRTIKILRNYLSVKRLNIKIQFILQQFTVHQLAGHRIINRNLITALIMYPFRTQFRLQLMRGIMVNQIAFNDRFPIRITKYRLAKYLGGLQCRCCSQADFNRIKIFNNGPIRALIFPLIAVKLLSLIHLLIENITSVCLINNNQIKVRNRRHIISIIIENPFYHPLYRCHLYTGFFLNHFIFQTIYIIKSIQSHQLFQLDFPKNILGLLPQCGPVNQKQNSAKPPSL